MDRKLALRTAHLLFVACALWLSMLSAGRAQTTDPGDGDPLVIHGPDVVYDGFCPPDAQNVPPYIYTATGGDNSSYTFTVDDQNAASITNNSNNTGTLHPLQHGTNGIEINVTVTDGSGQQDSMTVQIKPPEPPCENHLFMSVDESTGPRYRKLALNGLPMPDEKPQAQDETDQAKEETYVDAFNLSLRHSTTDVFVPLVGGELSLNVRRNLEPEIWNDRNGLWAENRIDEPFGVGWSTGLTPHIQFVIQIVPHSDSNTNCPASRPPADYAYVTDENGTVHRFIGAYVSGTTSSVQFFPLPTGRHEQDAFLATLTGSGSDGYGHYATYTFKRKFGTTLTFQAASFASTVVADRYSPNNGAAVTYAYSRVISITDRYSNSLLYTYASNNNSLIPNSIASTNSNGALDGRTLTITRTSDGLHIASILDPNGNQTTYTYTTQGVQSPNAGHTVTVLSSVTRASNQPEHTSTGYVYHLDYEFDNASNPGERANYYYQSNLTNITDGRSNTYQFNYVADHSRYNFDSRRGYYYVTGNPMNLQSVQFPSVAAGTVQQATAASTTFANHSLVYVNYPPPATTGGPVVPAMSGRRQTQIVDAAGNTRTYDFTGSQIISLSEFENVLYQTGGDPRQNPLMVIYGTMTVHVPYGQEVFNFDLSSGMAVSSTTDFSGNTTAFTHTDSWDSTSTYPWLSGRQPAFPIFNYSDPNSQTTAVGTKYFHYNSKWRVMDRVLDEENRLTVYTIDSNTGLRTAEDIYPANAVVAGNVGGTPSGSPVQHTDFTYGDPNFRAFMTRKSVVKLSGDASPGGTLVTQYQSDSKGRVQSEIVDPSVLALTTSYTYDNNGNKISAKDPRQFTTSFQYDHLNRLFEVDYPASAAYPNQPVKKTIVYDANSNKTKETDENGHGTLYVYDELNRLSDAGRSMTGGTILTRSGTNPDLVTSYGYNTVGSKVKIRDPRGYDTLMVYDSLQRLGSKQDTGGFTTNYFYTGPNPGGNCFDSSSFKPTSIVEPRGYTTTVTYDSLYRETARSVPYASGANSTTQTVYDKVGNPIQLTDPVGNVTLKTYDALNRPLQTTYASGTSDQASEQTVYSSTGLVWKLVDGRNNATTKEYDGAGRVTLATQPTVDDGTGTNTTRAPLSRTSYDANGNVALVTNARNYTTNYGYDERNRRTTVTEPAVTDPADNQSKRPVTTTGYDLVGNALSVTTALDADQAGAHTTTTLYDNANRPYQTTAPAVSILADGNTTEASATPVTSKTYDPNGNVLTATDANGNVTHNEYDPLNRLASTLDSANNPVVYGYDEVGNRISVREGDHPGTAFGYDSLNRNTWMQVGSAYTAAVAAQANHTTDFTYDALNKTGRNDQLGQVTTYGYDHRNRLSQVTYSAPRNVDNRTYTYDGNGNLLSVNEPGKNGAANVVYSYDPLNRTSSEQSSGRVHQYFFDLAGNRTIAKYSTNATTPGRVLTSSYDPLNRLASLVESSRTNAYAYDLEGNVLVKTLPDSEKVTTTYDALHRAKSIRGANSSNGSLYQYLYSYDAVGNVRRSDETYTGKSETLTMRYDHANRLVGEDTVVSDGTTTRITYGYDTSNNRTSKQITGGVSTTYRFNNLNQLLDSTPSSGSTISYTYDSNGNRRTRTPAGGTQSVYTYDVDNRLLNVTTGSASFTYTYDYRTRRVTRKEGGITSTQVVFSGGTSVGEYTVSSSGSVAAGAAANVEFVRGSDWGGGIGGILYSLRPNSGGSTANFFHYNRRGDVTAQTSGNATLGFQCSYEAWGTRPISYGSTSDRQRASTKEEDPTGLLNEGQRYRDLEAGVFLTRDPVGMVDGPNLYAYVRQNPWTSFDPEGLFREGVTDAVEKATEYGKQAAQVVKPAAAGVAAGDATAVAAYAGGTLAAPAAGLLAAHAFFTREQNRFQSGSPYGFDGTQRDRVAIVGSGRSGNFIPADATEEEKRQYYRDRQTNPNEAQKNLNNAVEARRAGAVGGKSASEQNKENIIRVRHFTNSKGIEGIESDGVIVASDQNRVFTELARGKPSGPRDVEEKLGIKRGRGNNYVEFDANRDEVELRNNPKTGASEIVFKGDVNLEGRKPTFNKDR